MKKFYTTVIMTLLLICGFAPSMKAVDYHVSFVFNGKGADTYFTSVTANYEEIPDYAKGFDAPESAYIQMYIDKEDDNITVKINGEIAEPFSHQYYYLVLRKDSVIEVIATSPANLEVNVNNYEGVDFGYLEDFGYGMIYPYAIPLTTNGVNNVTMPSAKITQVYVKAKEGYKLSSVKADGVEVQNLEEIDITDGMTLDIVVIQTQTSVSEITAADRDLQIFDMTGRRLSDTEGLDGLYIVNGKKVLIRK